MREDPYLFLRAVALVTRRPDVSDGRLRAHGDRRSNRHARSAAQGAPQG